MKRMWDHGLTVANGTDWGPKNVFEHIALQESCRFCGSNHSVAHLPGHGLTRKQSLSGWTANGAKVMGRSDIGALQPGMHFDMTIADHNPLTAALEELPGPGFCKPSSVAERCIPQVRWQRYSAAVQAAKVPGRRPDQGRILQFCGDRQQQRLAAKVGGQLDADRQAGAALGATAAKSLARPSH